MNNDAKKYDDVYVDGIQLKYFTLLTALEAFKGDKNMQAYLLETFIAEFGFLPDELGDKVRELLK